MPSRMRKATLLFVLFAAIATGFYSCKKSDGNDISDPGPGDFDKTAMLTQYADGLIIPAYSTLQEKIAGLQTASDAFIAAPSATTQDAVKAAYSETQLQYERVAGFQFGP